MRVENKLKKLNNKGMSLVEVLVAMIILSIAGVTFLQSFSSAVQNNTKAKEKQLALTYAQSMMETCKAYSIDELKESHPILDDAGDPTGAYYYAYQVFDHDSASFSPIRGAEKDPTSPFYGIDEHTFNLGGVNDGKFDVKVEYEPVTVSAKSGDKASYSTTLHNIHNPNSDTDAIFKQNITLEQDRILEQAYGYLLVEAQAKAALGDDHMLDYLTNGLGDYSMLPYSTVKITDRTIDVYITDTEIKAQVAYTYNMQLQYEYYLDYTDATSRVVENYTDATPITWSTQYVHLYTGTDMGNLKNVYMFYYPLYDGVSGVAEIKPLWMDGSDDTITVHNAMSNKINAYVVKQKLPAPNAAKQLTLDGYLKSYESRYGVTLKNSGKVDLYYNIDKSLYDSVIGSYTLALVSGTKGYNSISLQEENETLIYNITVTVSEAGGDEIVKLTGTTNAR